MSGSGSSLASVAPPLSVCLDASPPSGRSEPIASNSSPSEPAEKPGTVSGDTDDVPPSKIEQLVVELHPSGAAEHDIHLFLLLVAVTSRAAPTRCVTDMADANVIRLDLTAREAGLDRRAPLYRLVLEVRWLPCNFIRAPPWAGRVTAPASKEARMNNVVRNYS